MLVPDIHGESPVFSARHTETSPYAPRVETPLTDLLLVVALIVGAAAVFIFLVRWLSLGPSPSSSGWPTSGGRFGILKSDPSNAHEQLRAYLNDPLPSGIASSAMRAL
jgi:hypothetical protein